MKCPFHPLNLLAPLYTIFLSPYIDIECLSVLTKHTYGNHVMWVRGAITLNDYSYILLQEISRDSVRTEK